MGVGALLLIHDDLVRCIVVSGAFYFFVIIALSMQALIKEVSEQAQGVEWINTMAN